MKSNTSIPDSSSKLNMAVISELDDWTKSNPVRSRANGSYRFSGPRGTGSTRGSNGPKGDCSSPVMVRISNIDSVGLARVHSEWEWDCTP